VHDNTRPTFKDLNAVAAHSIASLLLPARHRPISPAAQAAAHHAAASSDARTPPRASTSLAAPASGRRSGSAPRMSPGLQAAQTNSAAALARVPEQLGRSVELGDILRQARAMPRLPWLHAPLHASRYTNTLGGLLGAGCAACCLQGLR
jgi:hypothetical protein